MKTLAGLKTEGFFISIIGTYQQWIISVVNSLPFVYVCTTMADVTLDNWQKHSAEHTKQYKYYLQKVDKNKILKQLPALNDEAFEKINCLTCAACCKTYSPRFKGPDIKRISKVLGMKEMDFISTYLRMDEDGDYVVTSKPCPFLGEDNMCSIYEDRPSDCHRFPYTDEDVFFKRPAITLKNATFCPIVYFVLENLIK